MVLQSIKQLLIFEKRGSSFQPQPKSMALPATFGLESVRGIKTECVRNKREAVDVMKLLDSTMTLRRRISFSEL